MMGPDDAQAYGDLFRYANAYERGILPEDGGLQSQPYRLMQLIHFIEGYRHDCQEEKRTQSRSVKSS